MIFALRSFRQTSVQAQICDRNIAGVNELEGLPNGISEVRDWWIVIDNQDEDPGARVKPPYLKLYGTANVEISTYHRTNIKSGLHSLHLFGKFILAAA